MTKREIKRGDRLMVPFAGRVHTAVVVDVRDGRIFVRIDPDSDAPMETFYHRGELVGV
ncbi:hypothetical protein [Mycolicibacillus trivialis]|uniref:hypothetical protein n=1 Tax=Mycolicibacillus trivialis TaxID=1798 RepID=UPI0013FD5516|nr:hypothetical protein [Mycolicibacillus trivialis]